MHGRAAARRADREREIKKRMYKAKKMNWLNSEKPEDIDMACFQIRTGAVIATRWTLY